MLFCSSVRTKLGIPMATAPISVSWIGMNGYLRPRQVKSRHNSTEYNVFVRYRALTRSMLAMMVRPSFTMFFMEENSSPSIQCGRPDGRHLLLFAMAIPQSASFRARTSLTPSPYHTSMLSFSWNAFTMAFFFLVIPGQRRCNLVPRTPVRGNRPAEWWHLHSVRLLNAGPLADGGGSSGVIAGKYFYGYPWDSKKAKVSLASLLISSDSKRRA